MSAGAGVSGVYEGDSDEGEAMEKVGVKQLETGNSSPKPAQ
ncbi:hypothetical protein [Chitinophaga sancti]|uniref:Uncharacterized protein n=1 Tax=Chitinophaga sancti TaxID=1004 RepID=A0ABZ0XM11_9BACT|nr:hypothetical protein [Chitinophaga sancti]WQD62910.1 hypothetical protein U0033_00780 [Chitinophaga sancti]WQG91466.1 hypothetical protein SR876_08135 [Chitinophaga sancti]